MFGYREVSPTSISTSNSSGGVQTDSKNVAVLGETAHQVVNGDHRTPESPLGTPNDPASVRDDVATNVRADDGGEDEDGGSSTKRRRKSPAPDQPDPDVIKMFVGQVPRSMDEAELKTMFEEFGHVYQINVLRDKITGQSKGKRDTSSTFNLGPFKIQQ